LVGAINGYTQRLGRLIDIRKRFLDNAAHQLRTPLTALKTQLGLMQRQGATPDSALLAAAQRTTDDAVRLTSQLLALTRAEHGPDMERTTEVDLVALARQVTADHLWRSHERGDDLGFEALADRVVVRGNAVLLQEALANLIDNAMHHGGPGVHITVRVGPQGLEVEDNGPGIPPEHQPHVFERFYRAAAAGVSGSGLGLAIVQEIARQHGAQTQVCSPVHQGRGTLVRLCWSVQLQLTL
jgi:two-component system sensor histidine kinase TctE